MARIVVVVIVSREHDRTVRASPAWLCPAFRVTSSAPRSFSAPDNEEATAHQLRQRSSILPPQSPRERGVTRTTREAADCWDRGHRQDRNFSGYLSGSSSTPPMPPQRGGRWSNLKASPPHDQTSSPTETTEEAQVSGGAGSTDPQLPSTNASRNSAVGFAQYDWCPGPDGMLARCTRADC